MHPDAGPPCKRKIVRAHTIQRGGGLSKIARRGEVYYFQEGIGLYRDFGPKLIGFRDASTFTGFCELHDRTTFAPIEIREFNSEPEQVFLLAFRALRRELFLKRHAKQAHLDWSKLILRAAQPQELEDARREVLNNEQRTDYELGQLTLDKDMHDAVFAKNEFPDLAYYVIECETVPEFLCNAHVAPLGDFAGERIQTFAGFNNRWQTCSFSVITKDQGGAVVFSWFKSESPTIQRLVETLHSLPDSHLPDAIQRFGFEFSNNVCISPDWWERIGADNQARLNARAQSGCIRPRGVDALKNDGLKTARWKVASRMMHW
ncbi:MAG TPA: hypothetical protein VFO86_16355 [Terriglobia bacterium]|nr:hypothetical protein [Terriglobia bacterium]